jgi:predicted methyltransferase
MRRARFAKLGQNWSLVFFLVIPMNTPALDWATLAARAKLSRPLLRIAILSAALLGAVGASTPAYADDPCAAERLETAINGPQRTEAFRARDVYRHPEETLVFFGVKPDQTIVEIAPGGGWYTEILAPYLRDNGKLYEALYESKQPELAEDFDQERKHFNQRLARDPAVFDHVTVGSLRAGRFTDVPANSADMVLTFRNIHNWIKDGQFDANLRAFYAALKPGGVLGVEEHRAKPGISIEQVIKTGYVPETYVIEHAKAAGFRLAGQSEANRNPRDTKDYPNGVWSLPPTLKSDADDRARMLAIGESDRMTLRFVKPQ